MFDQLVITLSLIKSGTTQLGVVEPGYHKRIVLPVSCTYLDLSGEKASVCVTFIENKAEESTEEAGEVVCGALRAIIAEEIWQVLGLKALWKPNTISYW